MTDIVMSRVPLTVIHSCAHFGHVEIAEFPIDKAINVSDVDFFGDSALHRVVGAKNPREAMMTLLVEAGVDVGATASCLTALHLAARTGDFRMLQYLLELAPTRMHPIGKASDRCK